MDIMDQETENNIHNEIAAIKEVPFCERHVEDKKRLNELEAKIRRRHPALQNGAIGAAALSENSIPAFRLAIFVLLKSPKDDTRGGWDLVGTAVAIECESRDLLLTAGHCVSAKETNDTNAYNFACALKVAKADQHILNFEGIFPVIIVAAKLHPDICILRRMDAVKFDPRDMIPLCSPTDVPWLRDERGWYASCLCYHCPVVEFLENDDALLASDPCSVSTVTKHNFQITTKIREASSGGAVVLRKEKTLLGILIHPAQYGLSTLTESECDDSFADAKGSDTCDIETVLSVSRPHCTHPVAVVPSVLRVKLRGGRSSTLYDWIKSGAHVDI